MHLSCQEIFDFLIDYQEGSLSWWERLKFTLHLWMCPPCARYLKAYSASSDIFRQALKQDPPPESLMELTENFLRKQGRGNPDGPDKQD